jgi:hypothetical protein
MASSASAGGAPLGVLVSVTEDFLTLYCDPGEDFGWCLGHGLRLVAAGTHKMWPFADLIWEKLNNPSGAVEDFGDGTEAEPNPLSCDSHVRDGADASVLGLPIGRIVCEDFRIYPWKAQELAWDPVRTARVIGAVTFMSRVHSLPLIFQGANIKEAAQAAGAEELYYRPLRENRHQNDAIQHFVFYTNVELMGIPLPVPASVREEDFK